MGGIFGVYDRQGPVDGTPLAAMDAALRHRGPGDGGLLLDGPCALGARQVEPPGAGGGPPAASEDRSVWVVCDGDLDDRAALVEALRRDGHRVERDSPAEIVAHLYERHGEGFAEHLRGTFACAVWDRRRRQLWLARDRVGARPLYYAESAAGLVFASELGALAQHPWVGPEIDPVALRHFLTFGYAGPARSLVRGARQVPPAHVMRFQEGVLQSARRYWTPPDVDRDAPIVEVAAARLAPRLVEAARVAARGGRQPVVALDGSLGSSLLAALLAKAGVRPRALVVRAARLPHLGRDDGDAAPPHIDDPRTLEARRLARHLDLPTDEVILDAPAWEDAAHLYTRLDEPVASVDALALAPLLHAATRAGRDLHLAAGFSELLDDPLAATDETAPARDPADPLPQHARTAIARVLSRLHEGARRQPWLRRLALPSSGRLVERTCVMPLALRDALLGPDLLAACAARPDPFDERSLQIGDAPGGPALALRLLQLQSRLPHATLAPLDRLAARLGARVRLLFTDAGLVDAACALPLASAYGSQVLDRLAVELLPRGAEPAASPVRAPIDAWLRGPWRAAAREVLLDRPARRRDLLDPRGVAALVDDHFEADRSHGGALWALCVLELWARSALDRRAPSAQPPEVLRA